MTPINKTKSRDIDWAEEMRKFDNQREENMREIRKSFAYLDKHLRRLTITLIIGIYTTVAATICFVTYFVLVR